MFGVALPVRIGHHDLLVQVEQSGRDFDALTRALLLDFAQEGGWLGVPFLLAMLLVSLYTIRSSLSPLRNLSEMAEAIGPDSTDIRLPEADVPREIVPLVRAVNSALDRLEIGYTVQREFTADAAHELRTPLAVLRAHIDTLPDPTTRASLAKDLDGMTRLIGQLLGVAQIEALVITEGETADLNAIAEDVGAFLAPMALANGRMIEVMALEHPPIIKGSPEAVFNALRNLVENALTHAPAGSTVTVHVKAPAQLQVEDKGPGVPPEWRGRIFQRFWRAERRKSGAGLGLAIVKRTMEAHGGTVSVGDAPGGGALFTLTFPESRLRTA
jgi:signal transduction histidine kinase